jgi:hypothetical protein
MEAYLNLIRVQYFENDIQATQRSVSLALGLFQKHILAIIVGAKDNFLKGIDIINDVSYIYPE